MMTYLIRTVSSISIICVFAMSSFAVPTDVVVHVLSKDAKLIGTGVGGTQVTIKNSSTGEILNRGLHLGATGDTEKIVKQAVNREGNRFDGEKDASYKTTLDIQEPTVVEIIAEGPLGYPHAIKKTSKEILLIPGQHITGEGVVLTINGFIVDIMNPESIDSVESGSTFELKTSVRLMCGCPTEPDGLWNSNNYQIKAYVKYNGEIINETQMEFSGKTSIYHTELTAPTLTSGTKGALEIIVTASDQEEANFGMDKVMVGLVSE